MCCSRFCARTRPNPHGPPGNGLCDRCNAQQAKLMQMINQFEPIDEVSYRIFINFYICFISTFMINIIYGSESMGRRVGRI